MNFSVKAQCTVTLKDNETLEDACYRQVSEAVSDLNKSGVVSARIENWSFEQSNTRLSGDRKTV